MSNVIFKILEMLPDVPNLMDLFLRFLQTILSFVNTLIDVERVVPTPFLEILDMFLDDPNLGDLFMRFLQTTFSFIDTLIDDLSMLCR